MVYPCPLSHCIFIIDGTLMKIGSLLMCLWIAIEPESNEILGSSIAKRQNCF